MEMKNLSGKINRDNFFLKIEEDSGEMFDIYGVGGIGRK